MKQVGITTAGHALVEISSDSARSIIACVQAIGAALGTLDQLLTLAPEGKADTAGVDGVQAARGPTAPVADKTPRGRPGKGARTVKARTPAVSTAPASGCSRTCIQCGEAFEPRRKDQTCCGKECRKKYTDTHRHERRAGKPNAGPKAASAGKPSKPCEDCGKAFTPWRKDQRFCSVCSNKPHPINREFNAAPKIATAPKPQVDRLAAIKAADLRAREKIRNMTEILERIPEMDMAEALTREE